VFGSIGVAVYRTAMSSGVPSGVSTAAAENARATLGGAMAVAEKLAPNLRPELTASAQSAFLQGLRLSAAISTVGTLLLAVFVATMLRHVKTAPAAEPPPA